MKTNIISIVYIVFNLTFVGLGRPIKYKENDTSWNRR